MSYADFITLLFAFFVVLYASSQADRQKAMKASESVRRAFSGEPKVSHVLGGTIDDKGQGNRSMRGPGGVNLPQEPADLSSTLEMLKQSLADDVAAGRIVIHAEAFLSLEPRSSGLRGEKGAR